MTTKFRKYPKQRGKNHPNYPRKNQLEDAVYDQILHVEGDARYEEGKIKYTVPERKASYTPDFILTNGIIIETKGYLECDDRQKHIFIKKEHPHLDIRFVFANPNTPIHKGSKTTYAKWCQTHGFLYATKQIPSEWFKEKTLKKLEGVLWKDVE